MYAYGPAYEIVILWVGIGEIRPKSRRAHMYCFHDTFLFLPPASHVAVSVAGMDTQMLYISTGPGQLTLDRG